jgi:hypothetical protein
VSPQVKDGKRLDTACRQFYHAAVLRLPVTNCSRLDYHAGTILAD